MINFSGPSPLGCPAPLPGEVVFFASPFGAAYVCVRPSCRSFSGWVCVVFFVCLAQGKTFARAAEYEFGLPFCKIRSCGSWFLVSVPVSVRSFAYVAGRSLPCVFGAL
ncbi:MAG: hypothetical protein DSM107014_10730 [Gomphosphaeria aponina SAG 52.96 = DSM 107014]|uniref:Uncharacterized protein n=1 Tax=Gomphosphaeria aponina SAG 52.96 = DSM 107014 TaxID=1521640 RepID=A0A941GYB3_9CHRO|nr:hypothetical protein [Gomphosphaeria aponina SAG 52.96 = DSM 107014]